MEKHWKRKSVDRVFRNSIFSVYHEKYFLQPRNMQGEFATIHTTNWVNVIPVADAGNFILVRQFRHGIGQTTIEIPGGGVDNNDKTPLDAASRELMEETGYSAGNWEYLGCVTPNPAIQNNYCYTYLARDLEGVPFQSQDRMEYLEVFQASSTEVKNMLLDGSISHALVLAAFSHYILKGYSL